MTKNLNPFWKDSERAQKAAATRQANERRRAAAFRTLNKRGEAATEEAVQALLSEWDAE